jgi:hypothetical protein
MPQQTWTEQIKAHLEQTKQVCSKLPANELLTTKELNSILDLFDESKKLFLVQCTLQGFKTK